MCKTMQTHSWLVLAIITFITLCYAQASYATPLNDAFANAQSITASSGSVTGSNIGATVETGEPKPYRSSGYSVWFQWTAPVSGGYTFVVSSATMRNGTQIYTGSSVGALQTVFCFDSGYGSTVHALTFNAVAGTKYSIQVDDYYGDTGSFTVAWSNGPANDNFANAQPISGNSGSIDGTNVGSSKESNEPLPYRSSGHSVWYRWTAPTSGGYTFTTSGAVMRKATQVYKGSSVGSLQSVFYFDTGYGSTSHSLTFNAVAGTTYSIQVGDYYGDTGTFTVAWAPGPTNDNFTNAQLIAGNSGSVNGSNIGSSKEANEPLPYRSSGRSVWYRWTAPVNGGYMFTTSGDTMRKATQVYTGSSVGSLQAVLYFDIGYGSTSHSLTFNAVAGTNYIFLVDDYYGDTGAFTVAWSPTGPPNDNFVNAQLVVGKSITVAGTNTNSTREANEPIPYRSNGRSAWYLWQAPTNGTAKFSTQVSSFNNQISIYTGSIIGSLSNVPCETAGAGTHSCTVSFTATAGTVYDILITDYRGETGNFVLFGGQAPANDNFANAIVLPNGNGTVSSINLPATSEPGEPLHFGEAGGASVWYKWTAPQGGNATLNTDGSDFDTLLAVYTGSDVSHLSSVVGNDGYPGSINGSSMVSWSATAGVTYYIAVDGFQGLFGHVVLNYALPGPAGASRSLYLQDASTRKITVWSMSNSTLLDATEVSTIPAAGWKVVATGDFNSYSKTDLVLQNTSLSKIAVWYLNKAAVTGGAYVSAGLPSGWNVVAAGDFNADSKTDLVLQNTSTNVAAVWYLNGATVVGGQYTSVTPSAGWRVVCCGDFNNDGKTDLVLQNASTSKIAIWYLNGVTLASGAYLTVALPSGWSVVAASDFNGDGKRDLVLQNALDYRANLWHLNGASRIDELALSTTPPSGWRIVGSN
jgi:hypothetical protein